MELLCRATNASRAIATAKNVSFETWFFTTLLGGNKVEPSDVRCALNFGMLFYLWNLCNRLC